MLAREAADKLRAVVTGEDILVVAGVDEARAQLLNELPEEFRERALQVPQNKGDFDGRSAFERAGELAMEAQYGAAERLVEEVIGGAWGERAARGVDDIRRALAPGRVATLVLHEDAVAHWGHATDARYHGGRSDEAATEALIDGALETSAAIAFSRSERLLEEHEGAVAALRWE